MSCWVTMKKPYRNKQALHMFEIRKDKVYIKFLTPKIEETSDRLQMG